MLSDYEPRFSQRRARYQLRCRELGHQKLGGLFLSALSPSARLPCWHRVLAPVRWPTRLLGSWHDRSHNLCHRDPDSRLRHSGRHLCRRAERTTARSVELIVQPDAHDVVGEMRVRGDRTGNSGKSVGRGSKTKDVVCRAILSLDRDIPISTSSLAGANTKAVLPYRRRLKTQVNF